MTNSIGSTSWAMTTNLAYLFSTKVVTWFNPNLMWRGLVALLDLSTLTFCSASFNNLCLFSLWLSGMYLANNLMSPLDWFLSNVLVNWLTWGGTFNLLINTLFCLWMRMYLGHFINLVKSLLGWMSPPILKFLGLDSKSGFFLTPAALTPFFYCFPFTIIFMIQIFIRYQLDRI